jgi:hypothetical protein
MTAISLLQTTKTDSVANIGEGRLQAESGLSQQLPK